MLSTFSIDSVKHLQLFDTSRMHRYNGRVSEMKINHLLHTYFSQFSWIDSEISRDATCFRTHPAFSWSSWLPANSTESPFFESRDCAAYCDWPKAVQSEFGSPSQRCWDRTQSSPVDGFRVCEQKLQQRYTYDWINFIFILSYANNLNANCCC